MCDNHPCTDDLLLGSEISDVRKRYFGLVTIRSGDSVFWGKGKYILGEE